MKILWRMLLVGAVAVVLVQITRAAEKLTLKVVKVDSEEPDSKGANAVDGNPDTIWHTQWQHRSPKHPHEIVIQLIPPSKIKGLFYLPRQDGSENGTIKGYEIYVSTDGEHFGQPVKKGEFAVGSERKFVLFGAKQCGFIKLVALSSQNGNPYTSAAEIGVITPDTFHAFTVAAEAVMPTDKKPFKVPENEKAKKLLIQEIKDYMALPPEMVHAHPAAANYPSVAPDTAKRVTRVITVHGPRAHAPATAMYADWDKDWQSTGLYAPPGAHVTVTPLAPLPKGVTVEIQIGCHTDCPWGEKQWERFPLLTRSFLLTQEALPVASAFGGLLFVSVRLDDKITANNLKLELQFANAVEAPFFELGKTKLSDWKQVQNAAAPWGELVGHNLILDLPAAELRKLNDPTALVKWWDKVVAAEDKLAGWPARIAPERVVFERQMCGAWGHSGYPVMIDISWPHEAVNLANRRKQGDWGLFHELGHNHQSSDWTFTEDKKMDQTEVTVNLFSLYCMEHIVGKPTGKGHEAFDGPNFLKCLDHRFGNPPSTDAFDQLAPFVVLIRKYGWEPMKKTLSSYQSTPLGEKIPEAQRQAEFVLRYSHNAEADLSGFFKRMGYNVPASLHAELKKLPAFDYAAWRKDATASK